MVREANPAIRSSSERSPSADRAVTPRQLVEDVPVERSLRPRRLAEYIGQGPAKEKLQIVMEAANKGGDSLDLVLLYGPPALAKTTLAAIRAGEMGGTLRNPSGPESDRQGGESAILTTRKSGDVLFREDIHRLNRA